MALLDSNTRPLLVDDVANLLVLPSLNQSIAADPAVTSRITTTSATLRMPVQTADPTAAWVAEGQEIAVSDAALTEIDITPAKLAALSVISSELANDSSPAAARVVGQGMARDLAKRIDAAFFGALASPAPSGLGALTGVQTVVNAAAFTNLDAFSAAIAKAENVGADVTAFCTSPNTALALAQVKQLSNGTVPLLGADGTAATQRMIRGVPLLVSYAIPDNVVWALDTDRAIMVVRSDASVVVDSSVFFTSIEWRCAAPCASGSASRTPPRSSRSRSPDGRHRHGVGHRPARLGRLPRRTTAQRRHRPHRGHRHRRAVDKQRLGNTSTTRQSTVGPVRARRLTTLPPRVGGDPTQARHPDRPVYRLPASPSFRGRVKGRSSLYGALSGRSDRLRGSLDLRAPSVAVRGPVRNPLVAEQAFRGSVTSVNDGWRACTPRSQCPR